MNNYLIMSNLLPFYPNDAEYKKHIRKKAFFFMSLQMVMSWCMASPWITVHHIS